MDKKSKITTGIQAIGHNYQNYKFLNGEQYKLYFYVDYFDNRIAMSIYDQNNNPIIESRQLTTIDSLMPDVSQLKGYFSVEGDEPSVDTIDNTSNLYYNYKV
jgi:hypothetical protein